MQTLIINIKKYLLKIKKYLLNSKYFTFLQLQGNQYLSLQLKMVITIK